MPNHIGVVCDKNKKRKWCDRLYKCGLRRKQYWTFVTDWIGYLLWRKLDRITTWLIVQMWSTSNLKLSCHDRLDRVWFVMKTRQNNDMTDHIALVYVEIKTKLSRPIWSHEVCDENKTGQWHDRLYRCVLCQKWYWTIVTYWTGCSLWWIPERTMTWSII